MHVYLDGKYVHLPQRITVPIFRIGKTLHFEYSTSYFIGAKRLNPNVDATSHKLIHRVLGGLIPVVKLVASPHWASIIGYWVITPNDHSF